MRSPVVAAALEREASRGVLPPARSAVPVSVDRAVSVSTVYRAVDIHVTAASQLSLDTWRGSQPVTEPLVIREPEPDVPRSATIGRLVGCMAIHGNGYMRLNRTDPASPTSAVGSVAVLDPARCVLRDDPRTRRRLLDYMDDWGTPHTLQPWQYAHLPRLRVPWSPYGLGPLQAAQAELAGALDLRDYSSGWFQLSGVPSGVLSTDQTLSPDQADAWKKKWNETAGPGTRVLANGLTYTPMMINPRDAQFLESQQFTVTQIARLMGVPASVFLASVEGNSQTYANVEQDWTGYVRFGLMAYLREIEEAFSRILPRGNSARFNVNALLRTDTKTRYESHEIALRAGFMTLDEVRQIEGLAPMPAAPAPTPTPGEIAA
jgi:HK97 family phage portal protein